LDSSLPSPQEPAPKEEEDLSWLRNLEEAAKQTGDLKAPKKDLDWTANFETPVTPSQSSSSQGDLSWLDSLGGIEEISQPPSQQAAQPADDLSWLNTLGSTSEPAEPFSTPVPDTSEKAFSKEDLSWLNDLGGTPEQSQPFDAAPGIPTSQEEPSWLKDLGGETEPLSTPPFAETEQPRRQTAPLGEKRIRQSRTRLAQECDGSPIHAAAR
jgi:hypothetical protein